ncbi:redox-sensing transcriptional repressor Rex [Bacteroidales bacterium]|nr:redox-sensing transcriptional repressor Rex [Bacteroidales bacterium]
MSRTKNNIQWKVPEPTLRRLPWYLAFVKLLKKKEQSIVSSTQIAKEINVDASQVAKDLSYVDVVGKTRVGYNIDSLILVLENFLGFTSQHKAFLFGVGRLGAALLHDSGLNEYGLEVVAGFDVDPDLCGTSIQGIPIFHISELPSLQAKLHAVIGILTVPVEAAQPVAEMMILHGLKGVWNFTPFRIRVPQNIVVQNTSIYAHLAVMFNRLSSVSI